MKNNNKQLTTGRKMMKAIKLKNSANKHVKTVALVLDTDNTYGVWLLKENYKLGKITKTWAYAKKGLTYQAALKYYNNRK